MQQHYNQIANSFSSTAPAPSGPDTISYNVHVLAELTKRMDERIEALRSLADFVVGAEPVCEPKTSLKQVASGMAGELCERVAALDIRVNALAHEFGRLERAIRG